MNDIIKGLLTTWLRKIVFGAGMVWIAYLTEKGIANTSDVERLIEIAVAAVLILVPGLWTWAKNKWFKQTPVIVPNVAVPEVKAIVAAAK
jgi:hypothetical protein